MAYKDAADQKAAAKRHYEANKATYIARAKDARNALKPLIRDELNRRKARPCADCGVQYPPYVMQFDHLGNKSFNVADTNKWSSYDRVMREAEKCEVVCANCHAARTYVRAHIAG